LAALIWAVGCDSRTHDERRATKELVGKALFFDTRLSTPGGQSCASCHNPVAAFADPGRAVSPGAIPGIEGRRSTPSLLYMGFSPELHYDAADETFVGGQFWDGRASTFAEQAKFPLLSAREMNNASKEEVVSKVARSAVAADFEFVFGSEIFSNTDSAFDAIAEAIASFEMSDTFAPFSSKYDLFLDGKEQLSDQELRGLAVFNSETKGNCAACHPSAPSGSSPPLFTDFTYDNLGVPRNRANPFYRQPASNNPDGNAFVDLGLALTTGRAVDSGRMKVPTLRNIAITAPYFHNGVFNTLREVVEFYNSRDVENFDPPEVAQSVNHDELGNLHLSEDEIVDLVAFLNTLTDGFKAEK